MSIYSSRKTRQLPLKIRNIYILKPCPSTLLIYFFIYSVRQKVDYSEAGNLASNFWFFKLKSERMGNKSAGTDPCTAQQSWILENTINTEGFCAGDELSSFSHSLLSESCSIFCCILSTRRWVAAISDIRAIPAISREQKDGMCIRSTSTGQELSQVELFLQRLLIQIFWPCSITTSSSIPFKLRGFGSGLQCTKWKSCSHTYQLRSKPGRV